MLRDPVLTPKEARRNLVASRNRIFRDYDPPREVTISQWAADNRILPKGTTSRPGPFKSERFQVEMMDCVLDPNVHEVVIQKCTQIGYSDAVLNNVIGYYVDADPKPIMLVEPTIDNAKDYGKKRITPMIQSSPALRAVIADPTSRRAGNTLALKEFPGGFLKLTGANSGAGLRSDPIAILLLDEVDAYPLDVEGEGDPIAIATRRTDSYSDFKIIKGSTPAKPKGVSPIERDYLRSDRRRYFVPCPLCGFMQALWWRDPPDPEGKDVPRHYRLQYEKNEDGQVIPESVAYICANKECNGRISERFKIQMMNAGEWRAEIPGRPVVGFHINALYSPWRENWVALAQEWAEATAERNPEKLKAFVNLRLGETWTEDGDSIEAVTLRSRAGVFEAEVPDGVGILTAGVDVQGDRIEVVVKGWGEKEESWLIAYQQFFGDPGQEQVWNEVDEFLLSSWEHQSGQKVKISCALVDSGGLHTDECYRFVKARMSRKIFACKGSSESGKEIVSKFSMNNRYRVKLFILGTDTAKDRIFARMKIPAAGPAYMHIPDWIEGEYLDQLTSEKAVRRYKRGRGTVREYVKTRTRNEALDMEVYSLAALYVLGQATVRKLKELADDLRIPPPEEKEEDAPKAAIEAKRPRRPSNWIKGWR